MGASYLNADSRAAAGATAYRNINLGVTGQVVKNAGGRLYGWHIINNAAAARFVKIYNQSTAPDQTATPVLTLEVAASSSLTFELSCGIGFSAGISARASNLVADNDTTAPTANDVLVNLFYS